MISKNMGIDRRGRNIFMAKELLNISNISAIHEKPIAFYYQGYLTQQDGTPVTATGLSMRFGMYDALSGGILLWSESQSVDATNGVYSVILGEVTPVDPAILQDNPQIFLGVTVDSDSEMTPRQQLTSVAYSLAPPSLDCVTAPLLTDHKVSVAVRSGR